MHDVFSSWDRRAIIYYLIHESDPAPVEDVVEHVVAWSRGVTEPTPRDETVADAVTPRFRRRHVRRLDEFGIVDYDPGDEQVRLADDVEVMVSPPWESHDGGNESEIVDDFAETPRASGD